jgi:hypothetical protein
MNETSCYHLACLCLLEVVRRDKEWVVRKVFGLAHGGDPQLTGPFTCIDWMFFTRHTKRLHAARRFPSTKHDALSPLGISPSCERVVDFQWQTNLPPCTPLSETPLYKRPTPSLQRSSPARISSRLCSVLVPLRTRPSLAVYRVHFMQALQASDPSHDTPTSMTS